MHNYRHTLSNKGRKEGKACNALSIQCSIIKKLFRKKSFKLFLNSLRDVAVTTPSGIPFQMLIALVEKNYISLC